MSFIIKRPALAAAFIVAVGSGYASPAAAQATRTWVSGVGDDANPCSRTAPCKTFVGAIVKTAAGGEINCMDSGGFGGVSITKSIAIVCDGVIGGVLVSGGTSAITVNAAATDTVYLSGLDIHGANGAVNGIRFVAGGTLHVENSSIRGFKGANAHGISFAPSGASELYVADTVITDSGSGLTGGGIEISPTGAGGSARVVLKNVEVRDNSNNGLIANTANTTAAAGISVVAHDSNFSGNGAGVVAVTPPSTSSAVVMLTNSIVANNSGNGIVANGGTAIVRVAHTTVTANARGVFFANGGTLESYGNNRVVNNPTTGTANNGAFSAAPIAQQ
jgi:hypothetical protein